MNLIVEYADGSKETIATNTSWKLTTEGPIRSNNEYDGEEYDARKELGAWTQTGYDDKNWMPAQRVSIPSGTLRAQMMPGMKVTETLKPVSIKKLGNKYILDIGQNMAGWVRFRIKGQAGDSVSVLQKVCKTMANFIQETSGMPVLQMYMLSADAKQKMLPGHLVLFIMDSVM